MTVSASPRRKPDPERVRLPAETRAALQAIATELRNIPRDCIGDRAELLFWLNRLARRVDAERDRAMVVISPGFTPKNPGQINGMGRLSGPQTGQRFAPGATPREKAEAVFKTGSQSTPSSPNSTPSVPKSTPMPPKPRTVTSRKGRTVRVETRRAPVKQLEMEFS